MATIAKNISAASITKTREALQAQLAALEVQEQEIQQKTFTELGEYLDGLQPKIAKIIGRDTVSFAEIRSFLVQREKGTLGSLVRVSTGDRSRRLTDEERTKLSAEMLERAVLGKQGKPRTPISVLADKYNCSVATINGYAPSEDELKAELVRLGVSEVPAKA